MSLIDTRTIQRYLQTQGLYKGKVDGVDGPGTKAACSALLRKTSVPMGNWDSARIRVAVEQVFLKSIGYNPGKADGVAGPLTLDALERYQNKIRDIDPPAEEILHLPNRWPRESQLRDFFGPVGSNQVTMTFPYTMRIAWDLNDTVEKTSCHRLVKESFEEIFEDTLDYYGIDEIRRLGLDLYGGCLYVRAKKGGKSYSTHSWGIAMDIDPANNGLRLGADKARLARPEYLPFWGFVEKQGMVSLGREKNYDWMHFQAARF